MNPNSPHFLFDPTSPGWLKRKLRNGEYVSPADVARVIELNPGCERDPAIREHNIRCLNGDVRKPRGRRRLSAGRLARIYVAGVLVQEQIVEWRQGIGGDLPRKGRGQKSFSEAAYDKFGLALGLSGPALANALSSLKSNPLYGEGSAAD